MSLSKLLEEINSLKDPQKALILQRFFKTNKGEYGEGDIFLGLTVPIQRNLAKKYLNLNLTDLEKLLHTNIHESRLISLLILTYQYEEAKKKKISNGKLIYNFYLKNTKWINNWDLVDLTSYKIVGNYLLNKPKQRKILYRLAHSQNLWEKRIAIISTFAFIKNRDFTDTLNISQILLLDSHDLIHKAVGWMLREVGKLDQKIAENFIMEHTRQMSRTTLRYAIEKFSKEKRQFYLKK